ncbi:hypothetical protein RJ639_012435 [Escallonia herrerae]|uniref:VQ domain-containing protein n=1 Tax=Escallonia herrerae TaxID=1293975 RepID=A0AA89APD8_9ASTE|nr:hypothetical protein RJ639_012435 [Escallonia herrerae]
MEGMVMVHGKQACFQGNKASPSPLAMQRDSHLVSKVKPKIRIIHIFAPEIIKTDVANFRELVQRLTGKPTEDNRATNKKKRTRMNPRKEGFSSKAAAAKKMEFRGMIKGEEEEIWGGANSGGGFLGGFADLEYGFMQELSEFPMLPLDASHMDAYGEAQLAA